MEIKFQVVILAHYVVTVVVLGSGAQRVDPNMTTMTIITEPTSNSFSHTSIESSIGSGMSGVWDQITVDTMITLNTKTSLSENTLAAMDLISSANLYFISTPSLTLKPVTPVTTSTGTLQTSMISDTQAVKKPMTTSAFAMTMSEIIRVTADMNSLMPVSMCTLSSNSTTFSNVKPTTHPPPNSGHPSRINSAGLGIGWIIGFVMGVLLTFVVETLLCLCLTKKRTHTHSSGQSGEYFEMSSEILNQHQAVHTEDNDGHSETPDVTKPLIEP